MTSNTFPIGSFVKSTLLGTRIFRSEYCLKEMISRQEALFGIEIIAYARMVDTAQHLHLVRKLGEGVCGEVIGCGFFKIFTKHEP